MEGIAKARGKFKGRKPTAQTKRLEMLALVNKGLSKPKVAKEVGVSVACVYNVLAEMPNEKPSRR